MSLPWIKLHTTLLDNETYLDFSSEAQHTFLTCLMLAGKQDVGDYSGRLANDLRPMEARDVARKTGYSRRRQQAALEELLAAGWITRDLTGTLIVERFDEKAAPIKSNRERQRSARLRNVTRNADVTLLDRYASVSETGQKQIVEAEEYSLASLGLQRNVTQEDLLRRRSAIVDAIWAELAKTAFARTMTKTEWRKRNNAVALDLAKAGVTPEQCVAAWESAGTRLGSPARMLRIVQDELARNMLPTLQTSGVGRNPVTAHSQDSLE